MGVVIEETLHGVDESAGASRRPQKVSTLSLMVLMAHGLLCNKQGVKGTLDMCLRFPLPCSPYLASSDGA